MRERLSSEQLRHSTDPFVLSWDEKGIGMRFGVAVQQPSVRKDVLKVELVIPGTSPERRVMKLTDDHERRVLVDQEKKQEYVAWWPTEHEIASCARVLGLPAPEVS